MMLQQDELQARRRNLDAAGDAEHGGGSKGRGE
jgi:hypothetical protein